MHDALVPTKVPSRLVDDVAYLQLNAIVVVLPCYADLVPWRSLRP